MVVQKGTPVAKTQISSATQGMNYEQIAQDPLKHVVTFIEKKIRNLDKRKAKLDGYRKMVEDGKPLDPDQTSAASKYDEVLGSLDFAKELVKAFEATTNEVLKLQRKSARREQIAKEENDNNRVCFVLRAARIMELLHGEQFIREDFLNGTNDACVVSKIELDQLVNFYECFIMKSYEAGTNVTEDANSAGNHMYELAEGRSKDIVGTTYKELRALLERIGDSKYFEDLPDSNKPQDTHLPAMTNEIPEESSESSVDEEEDSAQPKEEQNDQIIETETIDASKTLSNNQFESITSGKDLVTEENSKGDEIMATTDVSYHPSHTDGSWQQQQQPIPAKPEAGDYIMQGMNLQYSSNSNQMIQQTQHPAYRQVQTIQDVLAEVQGPCQFLQESFIDFDVGSSIQNNNQTLPYTGIDPHQPPASSSLPSSTLNHPTDQGLVVTDLMHQVALEPGFPNQQKGSTVDQTSISHLPSSRDSPSSLPNTVSHPDHINPSIEHISDALHATAQQEKDVTNDSNSYPGSLNQTSYMAPNHPVSTSTSVANQQSKLEYLDHSLQSQTEHQQQINLSFGQTTFGGQQLPSGASGLQQDSSATPDPPTTHIPLPNEQQSGYRSYQPNDNTQSDAAASAGDTGHDELHVDQNVGEIKQEQSHEEHEGSEISQGSGGQSQMSPKEGNDTQGQHDHRHRYGSRHPDNRNQHMGGSGRSRGYGGGGGYRSGPINQGGGNFHSQRNSNYRSNNRYNGNYDSMGRPSYSGNYPNNQPGYGMYRPQQQEGYGYNRRAAGGNMRGGRGGHQTRGGQRGSGNYNRSRTFRPQHSSEQAA